MFGIKYKGEIITKARAVEIGMCDPRVVSEEPESANKPFQVGCRSMIEGIAPLVSPVAEDIEIVKL